MTDSSPRWLEIVVEVAGIDAEVAADLLRQACTGGVAIEAASRLDRETETYVADGDAPALVKGYIEVGEEAERRLASMRLALQTAPLVRPPLWREAQQLAESDWRDSWKKYFGVQRIGRGIVIVPSWIDHDPREDETVVRIDPGMAFGTGQHPTTAMCLAGLEEHVHAGDAVLDLGCGSGILAIAAVKLGAGPVVAVDIDPQAVKAATENAATNGVAVETRVETLDPASPGAAQYDIVVANISGLTLERLAPAIAAVLRPGGRLIASGFLDDAVPGLASAFEGAGLRVERTVEEGVWRAIIARKSE